MQSQSGRFWIESGHPKEPNFRYELIQSTIAQNSSRIYLDFNSQELRCYQVNRIENSRPLDEKREELFTIRLFSDREINRNLCEIIFEKKISNFSEVFGSRLDDCQNAKKEKLKLLYYFYEDFENTKHFRHHSDYEVVFKALHESFIYRAFSNKVLFIKYYDDLIKPYSTSTAGSNISIEAIDELYKNDNYLFTLFSFNCGKKKNNTLKFPIPEVSTIKNNFLFISREWSEKICSSDYLQILSIEELKDQSGDDYNKYFFQEPETELRAVTRALKELRESSNTRTEQELKDLKREILSIEQQVEKYLLKSYNVWQTLAISTSYSRTVKLLALISLMFPIFFSLPLLRTYFQEHNWLIMLTGVLGLAAGIIMYLNKKTEHFVGAYIIMAICVSLATSYGECWFQWGCFIGGFFSILAIAILIIYNSAKRSPEINKLDWRVFGNALSLLTLVKLSFPRLLIAIITGWLLFSFSVETLNSEIKVNSEEIIIGSLVAVVTWFFMLNEVKSIAPYYSFKNLMLNRISMVVCASFMISFYVGAGFQLVFSSRITKEEGLVVKQFEAIDNVEKKLTDLAVIKQDINTTVNALGQQFSLSDELSMWKLNSKLNINANPLTLDTLANKLKVDISVRPGSIGQNEKRYIYTFQQMAEKKLQNIRSALLYLKTSVNETTKDELQVRISLFLSQMLNETDSLSDCLSKVQLKYILDNDITVVDEINRDAIIALLSYSGYISQTQYKLNEEKTQTVTALDSMKIFDDMNPCVTCVKHTKNENILTEKVINEIRNDKLIMRPIPFIQRVIFPNMLVYQALFAMFFGIFSQLILHEKSITESL